MKLIELFGKSLLVACAAVALTFNVSCKKADEAAPADPAPAEAPAGGGGDAAPADDKAKS